MIDPSIALQVRQPQFDNPLEQAGKAMNLMAMRQQIQMAPLHQQALQQSLQMGSAELEEKQRDLAYRKAMDASLQKNTSVDANGLPTTDHAAVVKDIGAAGFGSKIQPYMAGVTQMQESLEKLKKSRSDNAEHEQDYFGGFASAWKASGYSEGALSSLLAQASRDGYGPHAQQFAQAYQQDPEKTKQLAEVAITQSPAQQKLISEAKTAQAHTDAATTARERLDAELPDIKAKGQISGAEAGAINMSPVDAKQRVDAVIDPAKYPDQNRRALAMYNNALTLKDKNAALDSVSREIGEMQRETNPDVLKARTDQAVATEKALSPLRVAQAVSTEVQKQVALAKVAPGGFDAILDPRARAAAQQTYEKDSKEYGEKLAAGQQLQAFVRAAQSGNKAAPGLIPIAELRTIVNRVNSQELRGVSTAAGSALDRLEGKWGSLTAGEPIPPAMLKDIATIAAEQVKVARQTYENKVQINNKTFGGKVTPIDLGGGPATVKMQAPGPGGAITDVPADQVEHYKGLGAKVVGQ